MNVFSIYNFFDAIHIITSPQLSLFQAEEAQPSISPNKCYIIPVAILLHLCTSLAHFWVWAFVALFGLFKVHI